MRKAFRVLTQMFIEAAVVKQKKKRKHITLSLISTYTDLVEDRVCKNSRSSSSVASCPHQDIVHQVELKAQAFVSGRTRVESGIDPRAALARFQNSFGTTIQ